MAAFSDEKPWISCDDVKREINDFMSVNNSFEALIEIIEKGKNQDQIFNALGEEFLTQPLTRETLILLLKGITQKCPQTYRDNVNNKIIEQCRYDATINTNNLVKIITKLTFVRSSARHLGCIDKIVKLVFQN